VTREAARPTDPITFGSAAAPLSAPSRIVFGPHVTNLAPGRAFGPAHTAYYGARAAGGAGIIVTETASVHDSDHPYQYAPRAQDCPAGWAQIARACRAHGAVVLAGLGHRGAEGVSAHTRAALWGASAVAEPARREQPMVIGAAEIAALIAAFAASAQAAVAAGCDGVEIDAGPGALLRQFCSPLTNDRTDRYGTDPDLLLTETLAAVRTAIGESALIAVRLCADEGPGGITPAMAAQTAVRIGAFVDLLTVTRGGLYTGEWYRPGMHTPPGFNADASGRIREAVRAALGERAPAVVCQGSIVDPDHAAALIAGGVCDAVEMTRAQIADPDLVAAVRAGRPHRRCTLCNQGCRAEQATNSVIDCAAAPRLRPGTAPPTPVTADEVLIVGAGPAGLAAAAAHAAAGRRVTVLERTRQAGGALREAARIRPGLARQIEDLLADCARAGAVIEYGVADAKVRAAAARARGAAVIDARGGLPRPADFPAARAVTAAAVLGGGGPLGASLPAGPVLLWDPVGGPVAVALAEQLAAAGRQVAVATSGAVVGEDLAAAGDLAGANQRLARAGVARYVLCRPEEHARGRVVLCDLHTDACTEVAAAAVIDCGPDLPGPGLDGAIVIGDRRAPRTVLEAVREGAWTAAGGVRDTAGETGTGAQPAL